MSVSTSDPMIGRLIDGRYQVRSRIARGGMATVYLATDLRLERRVAVKIMHGHLADDSQFTQRFIQEARSAARLAHPNVVNVFDQGQDQESAYLVMEYLPGITLRDLLHDYGALTPEQTIDISEAVLSGLAAAHRAGIVHRDLKPENVLLADDGRIKIGDFGLARAVSANTATGAALLGTIAYLSPELVTRGVADARSDIYAVGIMMFEMLTGEQPFKGEQPMQIAYQHAHDAVPAPSRVNHRVPGRLDELVLWATSRQPDDRPADARELLDSLRDIERDLPTTAQKTAVLPARPQTTAVLPAPREVAPDAATQVLGGRLAPAAATGVVSDSSAQLTAATRRRRRRGGVIALVVLLLAGLAAAAGWYFTFGPGARIGVPQVEGLDRAVAVSTLTTQGFAVGADQSAFSTSVAVGKVVGTDPPAGTALDKGASVSLRISKGPQPFPLPELSGQAEPTAITLVKSHWKSLESTRAFNADVPKGSVISALDGSGNLLTTGAGYGEKLPIQLVVSAGAIPPVAGLSVADATGRLTDAGLQVAEATKQEASETVPEGSVIRIDGDIAAIKPNDTVTLVASSGPPPVTIPDVVGQTWAKAKAALDAVGLKAKFKDGISQFLSGAPTASTVKAISPDQGTTARKGDTVTVTLQIAS
ncbi:MAG: Stk1 family PASTA domain-containing Ser/Thr kinase [Micrococcales bacterium]|nr:Stk1 family PASTA domain-containing Ser/Thr kinase [Micrococcales bacterium]